MKRTYPESIMQRAFVRWFNYQHPDKILFATPNGGQRSTGGIQVGEGLLKGVPDLMLAIPRGQWAGLFIEMKILPNRPSPEQKAVMARLVTSGYACQVCYTLDLAMQVTSDYLKLPAPRFAVDMADGILP